MQRNPAPCNLQQRDDPMQGTQLEKKTTGMQKAMPRRQGNTRQRNAMQGNVLEYPRMHRSAMERMTSVLYLKNIYQPPTMGGSAGLQNFASRPHVTATKSSSVCTG